ncbi:MAG: phosphatidylglycerophosphatase A [Endomicrobium sp.]|jgi:phosphatidylglycerophosphatase A|nr:phosphatidylglycerophosphatase A [Endomicrobium sp.]
MKRIIVFFSSGFYIGYIKFASGTFGSLLGLLFWILFVQCNTYSYHFLYLGGIFIFSILLSYIAEKVYDVKDDCKIIIDEICGLWFALAFLPKNFYFLTTGFLVFRLFDITKPFFIKTSQKLNGGFGIVIDDVLAGILTNIVLHFSKIIYYKYKQLFF